VTERWRFASALAAGAMLLVVGCADDGDSASASTSSPATSSPATSVARTGVVVSVTALDNTFRPDLIEIDVGDEVLWENRGLNDHDVLYVDGDDWGVEVEGFGPGAAYAHVFTEPGEYRYYCSIHGNEIVGMVGTVVVVG
jgi:plastocyanin